MEFFGDWRVTLLSFFYLVHIQEKYILGLWDQIYFLIVEEHEQMMNT